MDKNKYSSITEARHVIFLNLVTSAGPEGIKRGVLINKMKISTHTFSQEYMDWLDVFPAIIYNKKERTFINTQVVPA